MWRDSPDMASVRGGREHRGHDRTGRRLGAAVRLEPREGPAGWRSVLATRDGGEIALWQPKQRLLRGTG